MPVTISKPRKFRLIGRTNVFILVHVFDAAGFIPSVRGISLDGRFQTTARDVDVLWLGDDGEVIDNV